MNDSTKFLLQFLGVIAILGVAWFSLGGKENVLREHVNVGVTDSYGNIVGEAGISGGGILTKPGTSGANNGHITNPDPSDDPKYAAITNKSPYFKKVILETSYISAENAKDEYVTLRMAEKSGSNINITGWSITSTETGRSGTIRKGLILPFDEPYHDYEEQIVLKPGDYAYVLTGRSSFGSSFLVNKCTGYYERFHHFNPSISMSCPRIYHEPMPAKPNNLKDDCLDYIRAYPNCQTPSMRAFPESLAIECQNFITEHAGYLNCVDLHKPDSDFYTNEWRIFLNYDTELWKSQRETLQLRDANGKVVDEVRYNYY